MTLWQAALLGILQGVTEFLPVSSSGHLALAQMLIPGFEQPGVVFDATLHAGTAGAVVWFERRRVLEIFSSVVGRRLLALMALGTVATAVVAFPLRHFAEAAFTRAAWVGGGLIVTGCIVGGTKLLPGGAIGEHDTTWRQALAVGLGQGLAVFPGVSRSGVTIAAGLVGGLDRSWAARFSFLLSVPVIALVTVVQVVEARTLLGGGFNGLGVACVVGAVAAGVSGYGALRLVIMTVSSRVFHRFALYAIPVGLLVLASAWGGWW
jgi:undecaprenyl-diphosphatase